MQAVDLAALRSLSEAEEKDVTSGKAEFKIKGWRSQGRVEELLCCHIFSRVELNTILVWVFMFIFISLQKNPSW